MIASTARNPNFAKIMMEPCEFCKKKPRNAFSRFCSTCRRSLLVNGALGANRVPRVPALKIWKFAAQRLIRHNHSHPGIVGFYTWFGRWIDECKANELLPLSEHVRWLSKDDATESLDRAAAFQLGFDFGEFARPLRNDPRALTFSIARLAVVDLANKRRPVRLEWDRIGSKVRFEGARHFYRAAGPLLQALSAAHAQDEAEHQARLALFKETPLEVPNGKDTMEKSGRDAV